MHSTLIENDSTSDNQPPMSQRAGLFASKDKKKKTTSFVGQLAKLQWATLKNEYAERKYLAGDP